MLNFFVNMLKVSVDLLNVSVDMLNVSVDILNVLFDMLNVLGDSKMETYMFELLSFSITRKFFHSASCHCL